VVLIGMVAAALPAAAQDTNEPITWLIDVTVNPGKGGAAVKMYKEYNAPTYEQLLKAGVISGYGVAVPDMHVGGDWTHAFWSMFSDLSQIDAIDTAFEAADEARGDALNETIDTAWREMHDMDAHWDSLMSISMYGGR
jgi:hypothetical protein